MESSKPRTIRGKILMIFILTVIPFMMISALISTYVYRALMQMNDVSMASAAGLYQSVVGFVLVMVCNAVVRKIDPESSLF